MENIEQLKAGLARLVEKETFSATALKGIEALRETAGRAAEENSRLSKAVVEVTAQRDAAKARAEKAEAEVAVWKEREKNLTEREAFCHRAEISQAANLATANTLRECFGLVFRNAEVRRDVLETERNPKAYGPPQYPGGPGQRDYSQPENNEKRTNTTETQG